MESLIERSTLVWRGVSPEASGGPSGSSLTLRLLLLVAGVMDRTVRRQPPRNQTPVRTACRRSVGLAGVQDGVVAPALSPEVHQGRRHGVPDAAAAALLESRDVVDTGGGPGGPHGTTSDRATVEGRQDVDEA